MISIMDKYKYLIIGGGIAGTTAAETIRGKDIEGSIAILGNEKYPLYSRVLLPNYLEGTAKKEDVFLRKEKNYKEKNINVFFGNNAVSVNTKEKRIIFDDKKEIFYEKLLIATGAKPKKIDISDFEGPDVFYFQNIDDAEKLKEKIPEVKKIILVGGSFNAIELAEAFLKNGIEVSLLIRGCSFLGGAFDDASNKIIEENLKEAGVSLFFNEEIEKIKRDDVLKNVITKKGNVYSFDLLVFAIGIERNTKFLENSLIKTREGVVVNEYLEANVPDVFAAGDVAEFYDVVLEKYYLFRNWAAAFLQGKIAGLNMVGEKTLCRHVSGYNVVNFGLNISFIGDVKKDKNTKVVKRGNLENKEYEQLFLRNNILVGATQINMNKEKGIITMLIDRRMDLSSYLDKLNDVNFNLKDIIN